MGGRYGSPFAAHRTVTRLSIIKRAWPSRTKLEAVARSVATNDPQPLFAIFLLFALFFPFLQFCALFLNLSHHSSREPPWSATAVNICACLLALLLPGCAKLDTGLRKSVVINYEHVANVASFQDNSHGPSSNLTATAGFWALFDVCSIDVQGLDLSGFRYDTSKFTADAGQRSFPVGLDGPVNVAGVGMSSRSPVVSAAVASVFKLGPATQFIPKNFYPSLRYRVAIFIPLRPIGYRNDTMPLRYAGLPEAAVIVQHASDAPPSNIDVYLPPASAPLASTCR